MIFVLTLPVTRSLPPGDRHRHGARRRWRRSRPRIEDPAVTRHPRSHRPRTPGRRRAGRRRVHVHLRPAGHAGHPARYGRRGHRPRRLGHRAGDPVTGRVRHPRPDHRTHQRSLAVRFDGSRHGRPGGNPLPHPEPGRDHDRPRLLHARQLHGQPGPGAGAAHGPRDEGRREGGDDGAARRTGRRRAGRPARHVQLRPGRHAAPRPLDRGRRRDREPVDQVPQGEGRLPGSHRGRPGRLHAHAVRDRETRPDRGRRDRLRVARSAGRTSR